MAHFYVELHTARIPALPSFSFKYNLERHTFSDRTPFTGQLHWKPIAVSGSGHARKNVDAFGAVIHMQENPPHRRFVVGCSPPFMRLARDTSRFASRSVPILSVFLVGESPTVSVPAWQGCEDLSSYNYTAIHGMNTPPPLPPNASLLPWYKCPRRGCLFPSPRLEPPMHRRT